MSDAAGGESLPSLDVALAYAQACGSDRRYWEARWRAAADELALAEAAAGNGNGGAGGTVNETANAKGTADGTADGTGDDAAAHADPPYRGLETFGPDDADLFFGRRRLVGELADRVGRAPFLAVFGASGSGKSSVLRAGLIPALRDAREWPILLLTPGAAPMEELAVALAGAVRGSARLVRDDLLAEPGSIRLTLRQALIDKPDTASVLIVVDQFEEVFTLCRDGEERVRFIDCLLAALPEACGRGRVVLGMRADFYARCAEHPGLARALGDGQVLVGPLDEADLRQVITGPAARAKVKVEPGLVEAMVADALGEPGMLPLVSHALLETWKRRSSGTMTLDGYRDAGGIKGGIAQTAERVYKGLSPERRPVVKEVFLRLTALGEGTEDTRRKVRPAELPHVSHGSIGQDENEDADLPAVLHELAAARLITVAEDGIQVAHEAVIRHWPRLRGWLVEDRESLRAHRRLTEAADEWERHDRDDGLLYRGPVLAAWDDRGLERLNGLEHAFLMASRDRQEREQGARRRRTRRSLIALAAAVVALSVLAAVAFVQSARAAEERDLAVSRQLAASARGQLQLDPELALVLAKNAYRVRPTVQAEDVLRQAVLGSRLRRTIPLQAAGKVCGVAFSSDGRHLVTSSNDGSVRVWDLARGGRPVVLLGHKREAWSPIFSPDGRHVAATGIDGTVQIWDWAAGGRPVVLRGHDGPVWNVSYSPDGKRVASAGDDGTVRIWNADGTGRPVVLRGHDGRALGVAFSPTGPLLASSGGDGTVRIWDPARHSLLRILRGHENSVEDLAFSPDGTRLASASTDGTVRVWDPTGHADPVVLRGHDGTAEGVAFSHDGRRVAGTSNDGTVRIWSATADTDPLVLRGHQGTVWDAAFSPDDRTLATASGDGTARLWDVTGDGAPLVLRAGPQPVWAAAVSGDGRTVAGGGADGRVRVWTAGGSRPPVVLNTGSEVLGIGVSANGRQVAAACRDGGARIWNTDGTGRPVVLRGHDGPAWSASFTPDGRRLVTAGSDDTVRIWNTDGTGDPVVLHAGQGLVRYARLSPDGRRVASAGDDGTVRIWNTDGTGRPVVLRGHQGMVWGVAFSPDGRRVAGAGDDGTVRIWNTDGTGGSIVLRGHQGIVWGVAFSPDGRLLASVGNDNTVRLWKTTGTGEPVVFSGHDASVESVLFAPDGRLITSHGDGTVRVWRCDVCGPIKDVLALADRRTTRTLTADERREYAAARK